MNSKIYGVWLEFWLQSFVHKIPSQMIWNQLYIYTKNFKILTDFKLDL